MSVIPLTIHGQDPTVVTRTDDFEPRGRSILIRNLDESQFKPQKNDCNISYDLRVGKQYRDHRDTEGRFLPDGGEIKLLPGMAVIIQTEEEVHFPETAFGQIVPKVSLLQKGIANTPSKVDPGYHGYLLITAFNYGKRSVGLRRGERFCSLFISNVHDGIQPYDKPGKQIEGTAQQGAWQKLRDRFEANIGAVSAILILLIIISVILSIISISIRLSGPS